jgi:GNAT superfamily N-acetyltransferase
VSFTIEPRPYVDAEVTRLVAAVQQEYVGLYGGPDAAHVAGADFTPPLGLFLVGLLDGVAVAMGGWRRMDDAGQPGAAEIKRMYVAASARRRGFARRILAALEQTAMDAGVDRFILNTGPVQPEAVALYESSGYTPVPAFGHYACHADALFYGKQLRGARCGVSRE